MPSDLRHRGIEQLLYLRLDRCSRADNVVLQQDAAGEFLEPGAVFYESLADLGALLVCLIDGVSLGEDRGWNSKSSFEAQCSVSGQRYSVLDDLIQVLG